MTDLGSRVETSGTDAVHGDAVDDSYVHSRPSDFSPTCCHVSLSRQQEMTSTSSAMLHPTVQTSPSGSLAPSPKRRRLESMDSAHCDPQPSADHHIAKSTPLPVIRLTKEADTPRTIPVNSTTIDGGMGSTELSDRLSPSPGGRVDGVTGDQHDRRDGPRNDEKASPSDRKSPLTEDS